MNQVTKIEDVKPCIEIEIRGKNHTGKSTVAGVVTKALKEAFPNHNVVLTSTDGMIPANLTGVTPEDLKMRLKAVETIQVLDIDNTNLKS